MAQDKDEQVVILTIGFLEFGAALTLLVPVYKISLITNKMSTMQDIIRLVVSEPDIKTVKAAEMKYDLEADVKEMRALQAHSEKYERELFPYGIAFMTVGFIAIVAGTLA